MDRIEPQQDMDPFPELRGEDASAQPHVITADEARREAARIASPATSDRSEPRYPDVTVHLSTGCDGNIGAVMAKVRVALDRAGTGDAAGIMSEIWAGIFEADSYTESLALVMRYVDVT